MAFLSLASCGVNLMPARPGGYFSDGARIAMLLKGGPESERWCALKAITSVSLGRARPRDWNERWVRTATAIPDGTIDDVSGCHLGYYWAVDTGDIALAWRLLQRGLDASERLPAPIRLVLSLELDAAFHLAYYCDDPAAAEAMLRRASGKMSHRARYKLARAEAAVLRAKGRSTEAAVAARHGLDEMGRDGSSTGGEKQIEREWFHALMA
jgi:hypothetical protein